MKVTTYKHISICSKANRTQKSFYIKGYQESKLKKPLEHPLSDSSEGEKKGQTLNKCLSEEKG